VQRQAALDPREAPDRSLTGWTSVLVIGADVAKIPFVELPLSFVIGGLGFRHQRGPPAALTARSTITRLCRLAVIDRQGAPCGN
jgi:hypothetical protein